MTADTRRQLAASDDSESGAERHVAMVSDITRHAGLGLQNRYSDTNSDTTTRN